MASRAHILSEGSRKLRDFTSIFIKTKEFKRLDIGGGRYLKNVKLALKALVLSEGKA